MGQLTPEQMRAQRLMNRRDAERQEKEARAKKHKLEMRGKIVKNGRVYVEKAICKSKHDALKVEKELRAEEPRIPTSVALSAKGWAVFAMEV